MFILSFDAGVMSLVEMMKSRYRASEKHRLEPNSTSTSCQKKKNAVRGLLFLLFVVTPNTHTLNRKEKKILFSLSPTLLLSLSFHWQQSSCFSEVIDVTVTASSLYLDSIYFSLSLSIPLYSSTFVIHLDQHFPSPGNLSLYWHQRDVKDMYQWHRHWQVVPRREKLFLIVRRADFKMFGWPCSSKPLEVWEAREARWKQPSGFRWSELLWVVDDISRCHFLHQGFDGVFLLIPLEIEVTIVSLQLHLSTSTTTNHSRCWKWKKICMHSCPLLKRNRKYPLLL